MAELIMLRLEGALQSWGESSAWDNRGTENYPTKSGILGLLACAMGLPRDSEEILRLHQDVCLGIRADRQGTAVCDFHTVQGMPRVLNAAGKPRGNIVSYRWYLQDASFLVVMQVSDAWRDRIKTALNNPQWCLYLGRKNCVPSRPVWDGIHGEYETILDALRRYPAAKRADEILSYETECAFPEGSSLSRSDVTVGERKFDCRKVWRGAVRRDTLCI